MSRVLNFLNPLGFINELGLNPQDINQDFRFNLQSSDYNANPNLLKSISNLNTTGRRLGQLGSQFTQSYQDMLNPDSAMNQRMFGQLRNQVSDVNAQTNRNMNQALASRGIGNGGMSNLLGAANLNRSGEQVRQGMTGILNQNTNAAQGFGNLAMGALGQQAGAYGQAGQFGSTIDARTLQNDQFNANNQNQYNQMLNMANYNQQVQNQNAQGSFTNSLFGLAGGAASVAPLLFSDRNLKTNIELTGVSDSGINIYEFDYKDTVYGEGRYEGVMAQEVPSASVIDNGVLKVDYSKIDVNFRRVA
tara:strand:+ start:12 stop:923 length:912 start_codon:yes stop_codon:yes gene_type:complete